MNYYNEIDSKAASWLRELISEGLIPKGDVVKPLSKQEEKVVRAGVVHIEQLSLCGHVLSEKNLSEFIRHQLQRSPDKPPAKKQLRRIVKEVRKRSSS